MTSAKYFCRDVWWQRPWSIICGLYIII